MIILVLEINKVFYFKNSCSYFASSTWTQLASSKGTITYMYYSERLLWCTNLSRNVQTVTNEIHATMTHCKM